jgi:hypothetical protein
MTSIRFIATRHRQMHFNRVDQLTLVTPSQTSISSEHMHE